MLISAIIAALLAVPTAFPLEGQWSTPKGRTTLCLVSGRYSLMSLDGSIKGIGSRGGFSARELAENVYHVRFAPDSGGSPKRFPLLLNRGGLEITVADAPPMRLLAAPCAP